MWFALFLFIGAFAGLMSGLLGIGGGIVVVPMLAIAFKNYNMPSAIIMHIAAGTSLASIAVTTLRSIYSHRRHWEDSWQIYKKMMGGVIIGTMSGVIVADYLHSRILSRLFGILVLLMAFQIIFQKYISPKRKLPGDVGLSVAGGGIGLLSGLLGIGGGVVSIPFLDYCNVPLRVAMVVTLEIGFTAAVIGTISFLVVGMHVTGLPKGCFGYIYWPAWLPVSLGSIIFAPIGAAISYRLPVLFLKRLFAVFLFVVAIHML